MSLTIDVSPELEPRLHEEAAKVGIPPSEYALGILRDHLASAKSEYTKLNDDESQLIEEINQGLTEREWMQYYQLVDKRQAEAINDSELEELTRTSDRLEALNAKRIASLAKLAVLRHTTVTDLMSQLGIEPPNVI